MASGDKGCVKGGLAGNRHRCNSPGELFSQSQSIRPPSLFNGRFQRNLIHLIGVLADAVFSASAAPYPMVLWLTDGTLVAVGPS